MNRALVAVLLSACGDSTLVMVVPGDAPRGQLDPTAGAAPVAPVSATPAPAAPRPVLDFDRGPTRVTIVNHLADQNNGFDVTVTGYVTRERKSVTVSATNLRSSSAPKPGTWYDFWICDDPGASPRVQLLEKGVKPGCETEQLIGTVRTHPDADAFLQIFQVDGIVRYDGAYADYLYLESDPNGWTPIDLGGWVPFHLAKAAHLRLECLRKAGDGITQIRVAMKNPMTAEGADRRFDVLMRGHTRENQPEAVQFQSWAFVDPAENGKVWVQTSGDAKCHVLVQGYLLSGAVLSKSAAGGIHAELDRVGGSGVEKFDLIEPLATDGWYSLALCGGVRRLVAYPAPASCVTLSTLKANGGRLNTFRQVGNMVRLHAGVDLRNDTHTDGAWSQLDLSSWVPPLARAVQLRPECQRNDARGAADISFGARDGAALLRVKRYSHATGNHEAAQGGVTVPVDAARLWFRTEPGTSCNLVLEGYSFAALTVATRSNDSLDVTLENYRAGDGRFVSLSAAVSGRPATDGWNTLWLCEGNTLQLGEGLTAPPSCVRPELLSVARSRAGALQRYRQLDRRIMFEGERLLLDNVTTNGGGDFRRVDVRDDVPPPARGVFLRGECEKRPGESPGLVQLNLSTSDGAAANVIGNRARYLFHGKSFSRQGNKDSSEAEMLTLLHPSEGGHLWYSTGGQVSLCSVAITGFYF